MGKKIFRILILALVVISLPHLAINTSLIKNHYSRNYTQEESNTFKKEIPQLSFEIAWAPNGTTVCNASSSQVNSQICSDGAGGAIITWEDYRTESNYDIYAQRIDSSGNVQWTTNGISICSASNTQYHHQICSDGAGGAIITWEDERGGLLSDIYAQRVDLNGNLQWTIDGVAICSDFSDQYYPQICTDGAGGAVITWWDNRNLGVTGPDIYAQRIDLSGNIQWTINGIAICTASNTQYHYQICSDGANGAIITWQDQRNSSNYDIYTQQIDSSGNIQWTTNGIAICTASNTQDYPQLCADGAGGAIITWYDYRSGSNYDVYAQWIDSSGNVQWTTNGIAICTASNTQNYPQLCADGAGGAIITWKDYRSGSNYDIYAQWIDSSGNVQWIPNGTVICTASESQSSPQICSDGAGGAIITWYDYRSGSNYDVYAQWIDSSGKVQWIPNGTAICTEDESQWNPQICSDGAWGAIISWQDYRNGSNYDIYAQRIKNVIKAGIKIKTPEEKIYTEPMSGYYPASYGFENDVDSTFPEEWISDSNGGTCKVIQSLGDHNKVVELYDSSVPGSYIGMTNNFTSKQTEGTVEFYFHSNDANKRTDIYLYENSTSDGILLIIMLNNLWYHKGTTNYGLGTTIENNEWYHILIEFNSTTNVFRLWVNGNRVVWVGDEFPYQNSNTGMNHLSLTTDYYDEDYSSYIDGVGYSWDPNYYIGDNLNEGLLISFDTNTTLQWTGYSLDYHNNVTILGNTTIPLPEDGPHTIQVFGIHLFGYLFQSEIRHFTIETKIPKITIHSPIQDEIFGFVPPKFNLSIIEANLVSSWYTIDDGASNSTITDLVGYIDEDAWFAAPNGPITIRFYAKDIIDQVNYSEVIVIKDIVQLLDVNILHQSFSLEEFNFTIFVYNDKGEGIDFATIQIWWDGIDVSMNIQNLGNGLYFISLNPITVAPGEDPILLNMIISADGYQDKYFDTYLAVDPDILNKDTGKPTEEPPLVIIIIASTSIAGGIGAIVIIFLLRKRKRTSGNI